MRNKQAKHEITQEFLLLRNNGFNNMIVSNPYNI